MGVKIHVEYHPDDTPYLVGLNPVVKHLDNSKLYQVFKLLQNFRATRNFQIFAKKIDLTISTWLEFLKVDLTRAAYFGSANLR